MGDSDALVCYTIGYNTVTSSNQYFPCGGGSNSNGAQSCCYAGDYCMENSMCYYTHNVENGTGYYMAGCTDPTWQDPACPKQCTSQYGADVIYDTTNERWNCCFSREGFLNCQQPSDFLVQAPAPDELGTLTELNTPAPSASLTEIGPISSSPIATRSGALDNSSVSSTASAQRTSASASSSTPNAAVSATASSTPSPSPSGSNGLSGGVTAGIVIGAIAGLTLLILAALFLYRWNKRNNAAIRNHEWNNNAPRPELSGESGKRNVYAHVADKAPPSYAGPSPSGYGIAGPYHELSNPEMESKPQELPASWEPAELGAGGVGR